MNNLPSIPPQDPGFQLGAPMEMNAGAQPPKFRLKKYLLFLRKFWWIPLITLVVALGVALINFLSSPPEYVSQSKLVQTERLQVPGTGQFADDPDTYFGTMTSVLQSDKLRELALSA